MDLGDNGCGGVGSVIVKAVMNLRVPQNSEKFLNGCTTDGLWSSAQLHVIFCYLIIIIIIIIIIMEDITNTEVQMKCLELYSGNTCFESGL
jgi:hypothetical protein